MRQAVVMAGLFAFGMAAVFAAEEPVPADVSPDVQAAPAMEGAEPMEAPAPAEADEPAAAQAESEPEPVPAPMGGEVARSAFTSGIENREPVDRLLSLGPEQVQIYYFTELRDLGGHTVTHRWMHGGQVMAEVSFDVGGPRWRVWSSKNLVSGWSGQWTVEVVGDGGQVLAEDSFEYAP